MTPIRLKKSHEADIRAGMPWIYAGDLVESSHHLSIPPGSLVAIENPRGEYIATGYYNSRSAIAARVLTLKKEPIDKDFFLVRLKKALEKRERLFNEPYYRIIHSEADGFPGLLVDRFGDTLVAQVGTAGMEQLQPLWMEALEEWLKPKTIILRNDISARRKEGLEEEVRVISPSPALAGEGRGEGLSCSQSAISSLHHPHPDLLPLAGEGEFRVELHENACIYYADLLNGQKTGWFYDQRNNRKLIAGLAKGKTLLDVYSHSGGFGVLAAKAGAKAVTLVDSSKLALELAKKAAEKNNVACDYIQGDAFETMQKLAKEGKRYDIVLADPPAFVKSRKDLESGMKGYEKVAKLASALVAPGGYLFIASCSHHATRGRFNKAVLAGVSKSNSVAEIIKETGAAPDHPLHPKLPQSEYLKGILLRIKDA